MNITPTPVTIYQSTTLGQFTSLSELLLVDSQQPTSLGVTSFPVSDIDLISSELPPTQQQELLALLQDYSGLFATDSGSLGRTSVVKHEIHTSGHPICQPVCSQPRTLQDAIDNEVQ